MTEGQVIISVDLDDGKLAERLEKLTDQLVGLKQTQSNLNKEFKAGDISAEEYSRRSKALSQEISTLSRQQGNLTQAVKLTTTATKDYSSSLDGERAKLNDMQKAFAALSKEQRESAAGQEFLKAIKAQSDAVKELESAMGDSRRNVGNYSDAIIEASGKMGGFGKATSGIIQPIKGATNGLKAMAATPIIAILNVLITIIVKLAEKFKQNGAAMESLTKTFSLFQGVGVIVNKVIDGIAKGVVWLSDKLYELAERFGLVTDEMRESQRIGQENLAIQREQVALTQKQADRELQVSELRAKAAEKNKYTAQERLEFLRQAIDIEKQISQDEYDLAKRRYELQVAINAQSESSVEEDQKRADLYAEMVRKQTDHNNKLREFNAQIVEAQNQIKAAAKGAGDAVIDAADTTEYVTEDMASKIYEIRKKYGLVGDEEEYDRELEELRSYYANKLLTDEEYLVAFADLTDKYFKPVAQEEMTSDEKDVDALARQLFGADKEVLDYYISLLDAGADANEAFAQSSQFMAKRNAKSFADAAGSMGNAFQKMAGFLQEYGEANEDAQKASKAFALAGIISSQAQSIAEGALAISAGIAQAQSVPFPANLAAIATTVATITSLIVSTATSFMQAKQLLSGADAGAFEYGGIVGGTSYTGDKLTARVNSKEMILTQSQQARLFEIANTPAAVSGIDYEALAQAMSAMPAPVLEYSEYRKFERNVVQYDEIARI